eukprot:m.339883 g.339883  ORF g.339883 m.339883 type:complete len:665 (+) comp19022_c0_seq1:117-2111(+)
MAASHSASSEAGANSAPGSRRQLAYLKLSKEPLRFHPVDAATSVFFDEANKQVFVVEEGATDVLVRGVDKSLNSKIMLGRGPVISIKFSLDQRTLAVQRTSRTIVFVNRGKGLDTAEYSQSCKSKSSTHLLGFSWTNINELVLITNQGLEFYFVNPEKRMLKLIKSMQVSVNWFIYSHENKVLLLSSSPQANIIHPYHFKRGSVTRLPKFEVELPTVYNQLSQKLLERDVNVALIYDRLYCMMIKNNPRGTTGPKAEMSLCKLTSREGATKTATLVLNMNGRFAVNVVDNLIVVHHQASKTSMVFDIKWNQNQSTGGGVDEILPLTIHRPVVRPMSIAPIPRLAASEDYASTSDGPVELYTPTWIVFQPNIIIDAKLGTLWLVSMDLEPMLQLMPNKIQLIDFLLRRKGSKSIILRVIKNALQPAGEGDLETISCMFDQLNSVYAARATADRNMELPSSSRGVVAIDQSDMYTNVFSPLEDKPIKYKFMVAVLVEYIRSLNQFAIPVEHFLYELVINLLVRHNRHYQLHQFLQYHVVNDSKHVACLLLSLEGTYPPAFQLALDMLKRLATANEDICDVLISKNLLLPALRFLRGLGPEAVASVSPRRFLEAAESTKDPSLFYTVFTFFEQRNVALRKRPEFAPGEGCDEYVNHFNRLFRRGQDV